MKPKIEIGMFVISNGIEPTSYGKGVLLKVVPAPELYFLGANNIKNFVWTAEATTPSAALWTNPLDFWNKFDLANLSPVEKIIYGE